MYGESRSRLTVSHGEGSRSSSSLGSDDLVSSKLNTGGEGLQLLLVGEQRGRERGNGLGEEGEDCERR